jgi:hypothetical protein
MPIRLKKPLERERERELSELLGKVETSESERGREAAKGVVSSLLIVRSM